MTQRPDCTSVVLAGGESRRFGADKASALVGGRTMLDRVCTALAGACDRVVVVAPEDRALPPLSVPVRRIPDQFPGDGPLGGMLTAFRTLESGVAFVAGCDAPLLSSRVAATVVAALDEAPAADAAFPRFEGILQPLAAAYRVERCLPVVERLFASGERRLRALLSAIDVVELDGAVLGAASFHTVNTPEELEAASRLLNRGT